MADQEQEAAAEPQASTALTVRQGGALATMGDGRFPLATLTEGEFVGLVANMKSHMERLRFIKRELMEPGVHYIVPGEKDVEKIRKAAAQGKVGISKAGAEFLLKLHNYVGVVTQVIQYGDPTNEASPAVTVVSTCTVHAGSLDGPVVGVGVGACTSWETKYRYRNAQKTCPQCSQAALIYQKEAKGGEFKGRAAYWCAPSKNGCSANFAGDDPRIASQEVGKVTTADPLDQLNTFVKMGAKRARVDGAIAATGSSDLFVQDVEDLPAHLRSNAREVEIEGTVSTMYGEQSDDPSWAELEGNTSAAKPAASTPAANGNGASDKQKGLVRVLLKMKLGAETGEQHEAALVSLNIAGGFAHLSKADASALIGRLQGMVDAPKPEAAGSPSTPPDDAKTHEHFLRAVRDVAEEVEKAMPGRKVFEVREGILHLVGGNELAVLKYNNPTPADYLTVEQLTTVGKSLKQEMTVRAARVPA